MIYNPQNVEKLGAAFREEIERAAREGFTAEELEAVKTGSLKSRQVSRSSEMPSPACSASAFSRPRPHLRRQTRIRRPRSHARNSKRRNQEAPPPRVNPGARRATLSRWSSSRFYAHRAVRAGKTATLAPSVDHQPCFGGNHFAPSPSSAPPRRRLQRRTSAAKATARWARDIFRGAKPGTALLPSIPHRR